MHCKVIVTPHSQLLKRREQATFCYSAALVVAEVEPTGGEAHEQVPQVAIAVGTTDS